MTYPLNVAPSSETPMKFLPFIAALVLAGCSAPGVEVWGGTSSKQVAAGHRFTVNFTSTRAEAYRTNPAWRPSQAEVFERAAQAMEQASGCKAVRGSLRGDVALVEADLIC